MKDLANIIFTIMVSVIALIVVAAAITFGGAWYIESRWGVEGVEQAWRNVSMFGLAVCAVGVIVVGWVLANRSHAAGAKTAGDASHDAVDAYGKAFEYLVAGQKALTASAAADANMAKAYAAQATADNQIRVLDHKAQLAAQPRAMLAAPEPVRRAPWESPALPAQSSDGSDRTEARFRVMY